MISRCGVQRGVYVEDEDEIDRVNRLHGECSDLTRPGRMIIRFVSKSIQAPVDHTKAFSEARQFQSHKAMAIQRTVTLRPRMNSMRNKQIILVEDSATTTQTASVSTGCPIGQPFITNAMRAKNTNTIHHITWTAELVFISTETQGTSKR